jgi:phosphoglycerate dehydrogenase-like enzyme
VIAWSQNLTEEKASAAGATLVDKQTLFREADVVTVHLVLSGRTKGLVGTPEFALMKPTARFVNTSRGPIVNEAALIEVLLRSPAQRSMCSIPSRCLPITLSGS